MSFLANGKILVIGSVNMDLVMRMARAPQIGETVTADTFHTFPGGKGGNQAVTASRLGASVTMLTVLGRDAFSEELVASLRKNAVDTDSIEREPEGCAGIAMIFVDGTGNNAIAFTPGSNARFSKHHLKRCEPLFEEGKILLITLEMSHETIYESIFLAKRKGMFVIFDPAPADPTLFEKYPDLAAAIDILKPNETEASLMTGQRIRTLEEASQALFTLSERGIGRPIITLGNKGAVTLIDGNPYFSPAYPVSTVDTTAAGDVFSGALAACLAKNKPFVESLRFAGASAGLSATRQGAQSSIPSLEEVARFLETH